MMRSVRWALWLALALSVAGCALSDEVLFKTFTGEGPATEAEMQAAETVEGLGAQPPGLSSASFRPPPITGGETPDTEIGRNIAQIRAEAAQLQRTLGGRDDELQFLRRSYDEHAEQYAQAVQSMGIKPGDPLPQDGPRFQARMGEIRGALQQMQSDLLKLNSLAARVAVDAATANQLIQITRELAARPDATVEDRLALTRLERELNGTVQTVHRMLAALHSDIGTQTNYAAVQRVHVEQLAAQVEEGVAGGTVQAAAPASPPQPQITAPERPAEGTLEPGTAPQAAPVELAGRRPFVTIRFDRPNVAYRRPLYEAIKAALERRPDAGFAVQGVTPTGRSTGSAAQRTAEVAQAMQDMGLPDERIAIATTSADDAPTDQVRIYVVAGDPRAALAAPTLSQPPAEAAATPADIARPAGPSGPSTARRPLVTIRFDQPDVQYEWPLYEAVQAALDRKPDARFDLVAVGRPSSTGGVPAAANRRAEEVLLALTRMGLPANRVTLATTTSQSVPASEVRLFVR